MTVPWPGSDEAKAKGCTCPRLVNEYRYQWGYFGIADPWVIAEDCPVHS